MADGREEREHQQIRRDEQRRQDQSDRLIRDDRDGWEPERKDS